jgi:hypothetical protein
LEKSIKYCKITFERIKNSPYIRFNTGLQNFLLLLAFFTLIVVAFDLSSDLAAEKKEVDSVIAVMENSIKEISFSDLPVFTIDLSLLGIIYSYDTPIQTNDVLSLPRDRAPPEFPFQIS